MHEYDYQPNILFRSSDAESILMMVAAEQGISVLPIHLTSKLTDAENLVFIPMTGEGEFEQIISVWRKDNSSPALKHFLDFIQSSMKSKNTTKLFEIIKTKVSVVFLLLIIISKVL